MAVVVLVEEVDLAAEDPSHQEVEPFTLAATREPTVRMLLATRDLRQEAAVQEAAPQLVRVVQAAQFLAELQVEM